MHQCFSLVYCGIYCDCALFQGRVTWRLVSDVLRGSRRASPAAAMRATSESAALRASSTRRAAAAEMGATPVSSMDAAVLTPTSAT